MKQHKCPTLGIYGLGLMGASLALAVGKKYRILALGRDLAKLKQAQRRGVCDVVSTQAADLAQADVVVMGMFVQDIATCLASVAPHIKKGAVVTDVGSVKSVVEPCQKIARQYGFSFVGSHPMTGSEKTGWQSARADLYRGAKVVVCGPNGVARRTVDQLWRAAGAQTLMMPAAVHDVLVAQTSHLPHVLAGVLASSTARLNRVDKNTVKILAGSFRDMTRIADSDAELWAQICTLNQKNILGALQALGDTIHQITTQLKTTDALTFWRTFFKNSRASRRNLIK